MFNLRHDCFFLFLQYFAEFYLAKVFNPIDTIYNNKDCKHRLNFLLVNTIYQDTIYKLKENVHFKEYLQFFQYFEK